MSKIVLCFVLLFSLAGGFSVARCQFLGQQSLSRSSYVIDQSGSLWACGWNFYGQLGVGDRTNRSTPTQVPLPPGVSRWTLVAGGEYHAIAVGDSDKLYTWGLNDKGQIGNGSAGGLFVAPVLIKNPITVKSWKWVSAGADHCEALDQDGILWAWGNNAQGQLGPGNTEYLVSPEQVEFPYGVTSWGAVAAGPGYTMMVAQNGLLYGCGMDSLGTFIPYEGPLPAPVADTVRAYSPLPCLGASFRQESRIVNTWYDEQNALIFDSTDVTEDVAAVADGGWHVLALTMEGRIYASGDNSYGQLGVNSDSVYSPGIVALPPGVTQFVAVAGGLRHSLAIGNDGWLYAWGDDSLGELGIGAGPKQIKPVKVMQVCSPLSMSATFTIPNNFFAGPYSISVNVKNTSSSTTLTNADAFLFLAGPLIYFGSAPDESVASSIAPNATSSATWNGSVDQQYFDTISGIYFAYVRAAGSAPLLVYGSPATLNILLPWKICDEATVIDSLTGAPIPGADLEFPGFPVAVIEPNGPPYDSDKMVSDENGIFSLCFNGPIFEVLSGRRVSSYQFNVSKENYRSERYTLNEPQKEQVTFILGPSDIQGTFAYPAPPFIGDSIQKVYYPDSLVGYAISRRVIFRTLDSGIHWSAMYEADEDLHDMKFIDPAMGWAVGDNGEILNTTDSGETWQITHVGTHNLRALALVDFDTSWAVGDGGTLLKRSGDVWTALSPLRDSSLTSIHFFDPEDGVIGANGAFYVYSGGTWARQIVNANIKAVYYVSPGDIYLAGTNGDLIEDSAGILLKYDSTYTTHTLNSLYFLNDNVGYVVGDSGSSFVTYDGGLSWADISEFPLAATSVNFFSLEGHGVSDNGVLNYAGAPDTFKAIVRGRLTVGNQPVPIIGAEVDRYYFIHDSVFNGSTFIDNTYTNEQGNFVFTGIDAVFPYWYQIDFTDSGLEKTIKFPDTLAQPGEIITLNYNDYTPPAPDTSLADVNSASEANLSLEVSTSQSLARIEYSIPSDGPVRLAMEDILGRTLRTIADGFIVAGQRETDISLDGLPAGVYYIKLESSQGTLTRKIVLIR